MKMAFEKKDCKECGTQFQPKNRGQKFCSTKCSTKYNRRENKIDVWGYNLCDK
jgi:predicted nucleic acid-binding Zn ribbon protein